MFERQAGIRERRDDVRSVVGDEDADVDVMAVRNNAALPEPAYRGRHTDRRDDRFTCTCSQVFDVIKASIFISL